MSAQQPFEAVLDQCVDDVRAGRRTIAECLARWPRHAAALEPLLRAAAALGSLVTTDAPVSPARRAAFMAALAITPQQRRGWSAHPSLGRLSGWLRGAIRIAAVAAPAAAVALVLLFGRGTPAGAATLTVFSGAVERVEGDRWVGVADDARLPEGARLRTNAAGRAVLTFEDGSTVAVDPQTELVIERARVGASREIALRQWSGRLWSHVEPYDRADASFTVRTPEATVVAHGTVFETAITDGETTVSTAEGVVEVQAGQQKQRVAEGESAIARPHAVVAAPERARSLVPAEITVDGPFAVSLVGPNGRATGTRLDGIVYQQIPGAVFGASAAGQRLAVGTVEAGEYAVVVRRTGAGEGTVRFTVAGVERIVALGADGDATTVPLRVSAEGGRTVLDAGAARDAQDASRPERERAAGAPAQERVVVTEHQRERVERQRSAEASATPAGRSPTRPAGIATRGPDATPASPERQRTVEPQRTPAPQRPPEQHGPAGPQRTAEPERQRPAETQPQRNLPALPLQTPLPRPVVPTRPVGRLLVPAPAVVTPVIVTPAVRPEERRPEIATPAPISTPPSLR